MWLPNGMVEPYPVYRKEVRHRTTVVVWNLYQLILEDDRALAVLLLSTDQIVDATDSRMRIFLR